MSAIAVTGMACRLPGATTLGELWADVEAGRDRITWFARDELAEAGVPRELLDDPAYVRARGWVAGADLFDAELFGFSPREAALVDPQQRLLLECAMEALEAAGWGARQGERVGVFASTSLSQYLLAMIGDPSLRGTLDSFSIISAERDAAATRLAYKLDLTGPAVTVQSACSSSLLAVHMAVGALRRGECDAALVAAASLSTPLKVGYRGEEDGAFSPDGRCRPFDAAANGTVPGSGAGAVVLRRLDDATADRDPVLAVVLGSAANNDGAAKVGFTAPSVSGQAAAVRAALADAGAEPASIGYIEAHGTATRLGDPIEVAALAEAFGRLPAGSAALGSIKAGIGHLDAAAGVASLVKTVLALRHRRLPPIAHFRTPNPLLELERTPFRVDGEAREWAAASPRRAGVTSLGVGGTNVHVVLEEAPAEVPARAAPGPWIVVHTGHGAAARAEAEARLRAAAGGELRDAALADVGFSAATGRRHHSHRGFTVADTTAELAATPAEVATVRGPRRVAFVFPGAGVQHPGMARDLYATEPVFRAAVDRCRDALLRRTGSDLALLDPAADLRAAPDALPALFAVEHGLVELLASWGIRPDALLGHSMGEYTAACAAGVLAVEDAVCLLRRRGELVAAGGGAMLAVSLPEAELAPMLDDRLDLAAVNAAESCVASGPPDALAELERRLEARGAEFRRVALAGSGHSALIDPLLPDFRRAIAAVPLRAPRVPFVSNVTGTWMRDEDAADRAYWVRHLRATVRFADGLATLLERPSELWVLGPGRAYLGWAGRAARGGDHLLLAALPEAARADDDRRDLLVALGRHWAAGGAVDWRAVFAAGERRRVALLAYPFQRRRHWAPRASGAWLAGAAQPPDAPVEVPVEHGRPDLVAGYEAPRDEVERALAAVWAGQLGLDRVGIRDDFFELGGDSLVAVRIAAQVRARLGTGTQAAAIVRARTVATLAASMASGEAAQPDLAARALEAAASLDDLRVAAVPSRPAPRLLLTGATGFLGPYLLGELLAQQPLPVTVLVRAAGDAEARRRVRDVLAARALWRPGHEDRIEALAADLASPGLGLDAGTRERLAAGVRAVYHAGAQVDFLRPYEQLEAVNVAGTEHVARLAAAAGAAFHHVSTLAVLAADGAAPGTPQPERPLAGEPGRLATGYAQSKWVAEHVAAAAGGRGLPVSIYRVGTVAGDSATGFCAATDLLWRVVLTGLALGAMPERPGAAIAATPVDVVAGALVALSLRGGGGVFHLSPPERPWADLAGWLDELGHPVRRVPFAEWTREIADRLAAGEPLPVAPLAAMLHELLPERGMPRFAGDRARELLAGTEHELTGLDRAAFGASLDHLDLEIPQRMEGALT